LGLLTRLERKTFSVQALVLCPTRELADQVANAIRELARSIPNVKVLTVCGGMPFGPQASSLEHGTHIVVGTPGRVADHLRKGTLKLDTVNTLVFDEADRMLDMGFKDELDAIAEAIPAGRQTLLFSATFENELQSVAGAYMRSPARVTVSEAHTESSIAQHFYRTDSEAARFDGLRLVLLSHDPESTVVFCNTKQETRDLTEALLSHGFSALAIHGDLEQNDRDRTLVRFANKSVAVLVATDVAARGLDIESLDAVINYHIASDPEVHVHRIGRTGRAGATGMACTFFADNERYKVDRVAEYQNRVIDAEPLPDKKLLKLAPRKPDTTTLWLDAGKKQKIRPGDILGALTGKQGIKGSDVGKINVFPTAAYVAVRRAVANEAVQTLTQGKLKGRAVKVRILQGQPGNSRRLARRREHNRP